MQVWFKFTATNTLLFVFNSEVPVGREGSIHVVSVLHHTIDGVNTHSTSISDIQYNCLPRTFEQDNRSLYRSQSSQKQCYLLPNLMLNFNICKELLFYHTIGWLLIHLHLQKHYSWRIHPKVQYVVGNKQQIALCRISKRFIWPSTSNQTIQHVDS